MADAITFPDAEAVVKAHLAPLVAVPVLRALTDPLPDEFVRVMLTGSTRRTLVTEDARVTLECWALTRQGAHALAQAVYGHTCALKTGSAWVPDGESGWASGIYPSVDPDTKRPRYIMTAIVRQAAITV